MVHLARAARCRDDDRFRVEQGEQAGWLFFRRRSDAPHDSDGGEWGDEPERNEDDGAERGRNGGQNARDEHQRDAENGDRFSSASYHVGP